MIQPFRNGQQQLAAVRNETGTAPIFSGLSSRPLIQLLQETIRQFHLLRHMTPAVTDHPQLLTDPTSHILRQNHGRFGGVDEFCFDVIQPACFSGTDLPVQLSVDDLLVDSTFEALLTAEDANIIRNKIVSILNDTGLENPDGKYFVNLPDGTTVAFCLNY